MATSLQPLGDRVLVERLQSEEVTAAGIVLPETAKEKPQKGTVVAVGPGARGKDGERIPVTVKVGDTVVFARYGATEIKEGGREYLILREDDIVAVVTN
ncbi:MAG: co-chaperone GroES [Anaerolineae bacterium]|jgi:chaperonin GroES